jgi:GNAT superfamily N-acetyltransferase
MRLREFAPSPDRNDNDDVPDPIFVLANRWWNATDKQSQIEHVLNSLGWSIHQVESEDDAVQLQHRDGTTYFISADDFDPDLFEYQKPKIQRANRDGIDLSFEKVKDDEYVDDNDDENTVAYVKATSNGKELGHVLFSIDGDTLLPQDLEVDERYRGQGVAKIMYDYVKSLGYQIRRSGQQTDAGAGFWSKHRPAQNVWETKLDEISDDLRRSYLNRAGKHVDRRQEHMARVRDRLNKGYEIYHADRPANGSAIVDRFEADTPALARQYYERFIHDYESDIDFDLRLRRSTGIMEIAKIPQGDFGDADTLTAPKYDIEKKPLPGGAGFTYAVGKPNPEDLEIMIFDGDTLAAELDLFYTQDATKAWRVNTVAVNPEYRSRGLGKALYGIALSILRLTIEAGDTQTRHGQRMWLMLNSIPGVEVMGYNMERTGQYKPRPGDEIIAQDDNWTRYTFPVRPGTHGMRSARYGTGMYTSQASMIAKWTGS